MCRSNDRVKESFNSIGYDLSDYLILGVTKTNRSEISQGGGIPTLRDEA